MLEQDPSASTITVAYIALLAVPTTCDARLRQQPRFYSEQDEVDIASAPRIQRRRDPDPAESNNLVSATVFVDLEFGSFQYSSDAVSKQHPATAFSTTEMLVPLFTTAFWQPLYWCGRFCPAIIRVPDAGLIFDSMQMLARILCKEHARGEKKIVYNQLRAIHILLQHRAHKFLMKKDVLALHVFAWLRDTHAELLEFDLLNEMTLVKGWKFAAEKFKSNCGVVFFCKHLAWVKEEECTVLKNVSGHEVPSRAAAGTIACPPIFRI